MKKLGNYFNKNKTGYTYLFFAQVTATVVNTYFKGVSQNPFLVHLNLPVAIFLGVGIIFAFFLPAVFILAAWVTFNYDSLGKDGKDLWRLVNFVLYVVVLSSVILTTVNGLTSK